MPLVYISGRDGHSVNIRDRDSWNRVVAIRSVRANTNSDSNGGRDCNGNGRLTVTSSGSQVFENKT
jgi:hypothetical protein